MALWLIPPCKDRIFLNIYKVFDTLSFRQMAIQHAASSLTSSHSSHMHVTPTMLWKFDILMFQVWIGNTWTDTQGCMFSDLEYTWCINIYFEELLFCLDVFPCGVGNTHRNPHLITDNLHHTQVVWPLLDVTKEATHLYVITDESKQQVSVNLPSSLLMVGTEPNSHLPF